jgi:hypothetical protein
MMRLSRSLVASSVSLVLATHAALASADRAPGVGVVPQGIQQNPDYAASFALRGVTNVFVTSQKASCYTPEVPIATTLVGDAYDGETTCSAAETGEDLGPYPTQSGSRRGYPATTPMLVKDHSESDLRVDPTNPKHWIGSSKWFVSAEGYNHLLGFYESFDGGATWPVQGHIPGYEGWTDNTDPIGAFDAHGNYYELLLPYQFRYGAHDAQVYTYDAARLANPTLAASVVSVAVRRAGATGPRDWIATRAGAPDIVAAFPDPDVQPDFQRLAIDIGPRSPFRDTIYAMWTTLLTDGNAVPSVSTAVALPDGTHTVFSPPEPIPTPHGLADDQLVSMTVIDPDGVVYLPFEEVSEIGSTPIYSLYLDLSTDGGITWQGPIPIVEGIVDTPPFFANTTFRAGGAEGFAVGPRRVGGHYPLYAAWEDASAGVTNILLSASFDGGWTWTTPFQVNDNPAASDVVQPSVAVAPNGRVAVAFYDRRLRAPASGDPEATAMGLQFDVDNPNWAGPLPPYGAANYVVNASVQFYDATLAPLGHNIRLSEHAFDPQLGAPHPNRPDDPMTFIGDYFGHTITGSLDVTSFVSTYDDGSNPQHRQQQVVATVVIP